MTGVDLSRSPDQRALAEIKRLFDRYLVVLFRAQRLPHEAQVGFARRLGRLQMPELSVLSNVGGDGRPKGKHPDRGTLLWHTDSSYAGYPPYATLLFAQAAPATGGHTLFADTLSACEALPESERVRLSPLRVLHDQRASRRKTGYGPLPAERVKPAVSHPLLRTHPPTGRRGIYLGSHADRIVGLSTEASGELIARLTAHATEPRFVYEHSWQPGDLLIWDNRALLHRATEYDTARESRIMRRSVLKGDAPY